MSVIVRAGPFVSITFPKAFADVFERNTLTITRLDGRHFATLAPPDWDTADVYDDETGYCAYSFENPAVKRQHAGASADPRR